MLAGSVRCARNAMPVPAPTVATADHHYLSPCIIHYHLACIVLYRYSLSLSCISIAKIQQGMNMSHHGWFFHIMKGDTVGRATLLLEFGWPQSIVGFVPIGLRRHRWCPAVMGSRRKGMESFPALLVACIDDANVKDVFEASCNKDVFHRRVLLGKTLGMIEAFVDEFSQRGLR